MASLRSPFPFTRRVGPCKPIVWQEVAAQHFSFYGVAFSAQAHRPHHKKKRCREIDTFLPFLIGLRKLGIEHRSARLSLSLAVGALASRSFGKKLLRTDFCRAFRLDTASPSLTTAATAESRGCLQPFPRRASSHRNLFL